MSLLLLDLAKILFQLPLLCSNSHHAKAIVVLYLTTILLIYVCGGLLVDLESSLSKGEQGNDTDTKGTIESCVCIILYCTSMISKLWRKKEHWTFEKKYVTVCKCYIPRLIVIPHDSQPFKVVRARYILVSN